ncbi:MAG: acetolactate decarboxylase [Fidelibacterota bacterium]
MRKFFTLMLILFLFLSCSPVTNTTTLDNALTQVATIDALLAGVYDGHMTLEKLKSYGNFGLGTFDKLDGEMVVLNGVVYQVKVDGKVYVPDDTLTTPFAAVSYFKTTEDYELDDNIEMDSLLSLLDRTILNKNQFVGIKITGTFEYMKTRSVPAQEKPYPPLVEVIPDQAVFEMKNIKGTIVGYFCPEFVEGINVPGYHLHFLSEDRQKGGHILSLTTDDCKIKLDSYNEFTLILPEDNEDFNNTDLDVDRSDELDDVENDD